MMNALLALALIAPAASTTPTTPSTTTTPTPTTPAGDVCASLPTRDVAVEISFTGVPSALNRARADAYQKCTAAAPAGRVAKIFIQGPNGGGGGFMGSYNVVDAGKVRNGPRAYGNEPPNTQASLDNLVDVVARNAVTFAITPDAPPLAADDAAVCSALKGVRIGLASTGTTNPAATAEVAARLEERCATVVHLASADDEAGKKRADYVVVLDVRSEQMKDRMKMGASDVPMFRVAMTAHIAAGARSVGDVFADNVLIGMTLESTIVAGDKQWKSAGARGKPPLPWRTADDVVAWIVKDRGAAAHPR
jgi:hypothetical protein